MDTAVDEEGGRLDRAVAGNAIAVCIDRDDVGGHKLKPMKTLGIDQEGLLVHRIAEMIAHPFVQPHNGSTAQGAGEIDLVLFYVRQYSPRMMFRSGSPLAKRCACAAAKVKA